MKILKSLLWSLTFPIAALVGQVIGNLLGEFLYFMYIDVMARNIPDILNQIAPVLIGGAVGGAAAAGVINRYAHPVHLAALMILPTIILAASSAGVVMKYIEGRGFIDSLGMLMANVAMITIFYRLVRGKDNSTEPASTKEVEKIVHQYGEILQHASPAPGSVADQDKLPYPKEVIKTALITALRHNADSHQKDALEAAYLGLANWQPDVGDTDQGFDLTNVDTMLEPSELLAMHESSQHWEQIVQSEEESLYAELRALDL